jgi:hypothetical protein
MILMLKIGDDSASPRGGTIEEGLSPDSLPLFPQPYKPQKKEDALGLLPEKQGLTWLRNGG